MMLDIIARGMAAKALQIGAPTDKQIMDSLSVLAENGKITTGATEEQAAQIAITAIKQISPSLKAVKEITFVCFSEEDKKIYDKLLKAR